MGVSEEGEKGEGGIGKHKIRDVDNRCPNPIFIDLDQQR